MTPETHVLHNVVRRVRRRLGLAAALWIVTRSSAAAALLILGWALVTMILPLPFPLGGVAAAAAGGALAALLGLSWGLRPSPLAAARVADHRLGLADRLSTALELLSAPSRGDGLACLQIADALKRAQGLAARDAAPIAVPREAWLTFGAGLAIVLWAHFLQGWPLPGLPAARTAAVIHAEGRTLMEIGRQLEGTARTQSLPEARRVAPRLQDLGRRLEGPRVSRQVALGLLRETEREIQDAQAHVERRLSGVGPGAARGTSPAHLAPTTPTDPSRLHQAIRELEALTGQLRSDSTPRSREDLAERLRNLSQTLEQMGAPAGSRQSLAAARREVEEGRMGGASPALGDALQDLQSLERMFGDEQALGETKRQLQQSADRIAQGGSANSNTKVTAQQAQEPTSPPTAPGPNPIAGTSEDGTPPPPGPNQGSKPGEGRGRTMGAPTPRLGGSRVEEHLAGRQGEGTSTTRDLLAPGRAGVSQLPAQSVPADIAHQNDRALSRDPLPAAYLTIIRRYFETLGGQR
jgi:hypothetical protein